MTKIKFVTFSNVKPAPLDLDAFDLPPAPTPPAPAPTVEVLPLPAHLTLREAAAALRCSERTVKRRIAEGRLKSPARVAGGSSKVLVTRASVLSYLKPESR